MCLIFLWPHPKSGHTMFMDNIPLTLALLLGETAHPLSVAPIAQECREGCSHVNWWIPLKTTWFAWFSFFPPPAPIIIVGDEPLLPQVPPPSHSNVAPTGSNCCYWSHGSFSTTTLIVRKCTWDAKVQMLLMVPGTLEGCLNEGAPFSLLPLSVTMVHSMGFRGFVTRFKSQFSYLLAMWPWTSFSTFLCCNFLIIVNKNNT